MMAKRCRGMVFSRITAVVIGGVISACGDPTGSVPIEATGTYSLVGVNSGGLPARVAETPEQRVEIISGEMVVLLGGDFREERVSRITTATGTNTTSTFVNGTLHVRQSALEVHAEGGGRYSGFFTRNAARTELSYTVPLDGAEITYTYRQN